jgi:acetyl-CoA acetyltransferase
VAITAREWASKNPSAIARKPLTMDEYLSSPWIVEPMRILDCAFPVNGGIALLVSSAAAGAELRPDLVRITGIGQGHPGNLRRAGFEVEVSSGARQAATQAIAMSTLELTDIDLCELYDCFTYTTLVTLEDYGFCAKGDGGDFVASGAIGPDGSIPTNTGGGQLSGYYMQGMTPLSEAVIQLRNEGGDRQVSGAQTALVGCQGGIFDHHLCLVLTAGEAL